MTNSESSAGVPGGESQETPVAGTVASAEARPTGIYWDPEVWDLARSAYLADLDDDPESPGSFIGWMQSALEQHVRLSPEARVARTAGLPEPSGGRGFNKQMRIRVDLMTRVEDAIVEDRRQLGRADSRSSFVRAAVLAAAVAARTRRGGRLPPPPHKLPTRPPRRNRPLS